jgi:hypothetical protein
LKKTFPDFSEELITMKQLPIHCHHACCPRLIGHKSRQITAKDHPEWSCLQRNLKGGVVTKLRPWKPPEPAAWSITGEATEIHC